VFITRFVSNAESPVSSSRRPVLVALPALVAVGVTALILAITAGSHTSSQLPQVRDMAPAWNLGVGTVRGGLAPWGNRAWAARR